MSSHKVEDYEHLVDLFLEPEFDPLSKTAAPIPQSKFIHECDIDDGLEEPDGVHHIEVKHNQFFIKKVGRTLAECGDEYFRSYQPAAEASAAGQAPWHNISQRLQKVFNKVAEVSIKVKDPAVQKAEQEKAWETFKDIMNSSIAGTSAEDSYRTLGAFLLTLHGLRFLQEGAKGVARSFYLRYLHEKEMDEAVSKAGGLEGLMARELD